MDPGALVRAARRRAREKAYAEALRRATLDPAALEPPPRRLAERLVEPSPRAFEGWRWVVAYVRPSAAREIADDLTTLGFSAYCPLGRRIVLRGRVPKGASAGVEKRARREENFPVFGGYLFVGEAGEPLTRDIHSGVVEVLGDARGRLIVPASALAAINAAECEGRWDAARRTPWKVAPWMKPNVRAKIASGAFAGFRATVEEIERGGKVGVLADIFGRRTRMSVDPAILVEA
jgi:transcription antitermination factor NusG